MTLAFAWFVALFLALEGPAAVAAPVEIVDKNGTLILSSGGAVRAEVALPARARQIRRVGDLALVALGPHGLWVIDIADPAKPVVAAKLAEGRDVIGVLVGEGSTVHAVIANYALASFDLREPKRPVSVAFPTPDGAPTGARALSATSQPTAAKPPERAAVQGRILQVTRGEVIVDRGRAHGLALGDRIQILSQELVERPNLTTGAPERVPSNEPVAVLVIDAVDEGRASAALHRGDRCRPGDRFVTTSEPPTERLLAPPRQDYRHRVLFMFRPFVELGTLGVGSISDLRYGYRFAIPLSLEVGLSPLAFEVRRGEGKRHFPTAFDATASYDTDFFAVGLGAGAMIFSPEEIEAVGPFGTTTLNTGETNVHMTLAQSARLGNLDGLSVELRNTFVYRKETNVGEAAFHWGSTEAHAYIPLTRRLTIAGGGGGGTNGWAYGELGVRTYFKGTGGAGTLIVPVSLGVGGFTQEPSRAGPLVTIGLELRL
jgi:hypothetical protein